MASLLNKLKAETRDKRPHLQKKSLVSQSNAASHTSTVNELRFKLLDHLPYSSDLAASNLFLFPQLKTALGGQSY